MPQHDVSLEDIAQRLDEIATSGLAGAPLCAAELQQRGYTRQEAYGLLRRHGVQVPGGRRLRISRSVLERIERGELQA